MAFIVAYNADSEVSVGTNQAVINMAGSGGATWDNSDVDDGTFYYRVQRATNTAFSANVGYSTHYTQNFFGFTLAFPFDNNSTIASLSPSTTYYYRVQTSFSTDTGYTSASGPIAYATLTTSASAAPPIIDFTVSTTTGYSPLVVALTGTNTGGALSSWAIAWGDGSVIYDTHYSLSPEESFESPHIKAYTVVGTYTAIATGTNADGSDTETKVSLINVVTPVVTATFTTLEFNTDPDWDGYIVKSVSLVDASTYTGFVDSPEQARLWTITGSSPPETATSSDDPLNFFVVGNVSAAGNWSVTLKKTVGAITSTATKTNAFVMPYAKVHATFTATNPTGYSPLAVDFRNYFGSVLRPDSDKVTGDGLSVLWNFGDTQTSTSTASQISHTYTTESAYNVSLTVTGSHTATTTVSNVATRTDYVVVFSSGTYHNLLGGLFRDVQWSLMCDPTATPCEAFDEFGGVDNLTTIYYRRLREFLRDTEVTQVETALGADTAGVYPLPANLIKLLRVEVGSYRVEPLDRKQADLANQSWGTTTTTGDILGYVIEPEDALTLQLVPKLTGQAIKVLYVKAPNTPSVPGDCLTWDILPLPHSLSWVVKWGMLADLLRQEGEMNDPARAQFAEEVYQVGVELTKILLYPRRG